MGVPLWVYFLLLAVLGGGALLAIDRIVRVGTRGDTADLPLDAVFFSGLALTLAVMVSTVAFFTGALFLAAAAGLAGAAVLAAVYLRRRAQAAKDAAWRSEQIGEEEARVAETARLDPANAAAWARLSELSEKKGDYPAAIKHYRRVCELEPGEMNERRLRSLQQRARDALRAGGGN